MIKKKFEWEVNILYFYFHLNPLLIKIIIIIAVRTIAWYLFIKGLLIIHSHTLCLFLVFWLLFSQQSSSTSSCFHDFSPEPDVFQWMIMLMEMLKRIIYYSLFSVWNRFCRTYRIWCTWYTVLVEHHNHHHPHRHRMLVNVLLNQSEYVFSSVQFIIMMFMLMMMMINWYDNVNWKLHSGL